MLLISIDDLSAHLPLFPGEKPYKLFAAPSVFAMVGKATRERWIAYRMGIFQFFGANEQVMQYRELTGIRRNAELFEALAPRYQGMAEVSGIEWIVEDLEVFPSVAEQRAQLIAQGYLAG